MEITNVDIKQACILHVDQNERFFADKLIDNAHIAGCFATICSSVNFISPCHVTHKEEIMKLKDWHQQLTDLIKSNSPSLDVSLPNIASCSVGPSR